ncbi:MAG: CCA tRNA nucleotidyltransferase [Lachnospiraceae bacterium]|nr:CCA tRNA nucleotidyltransferase [Lachnospiraceae bacterium]
MKIHLPEKVKNIIQTIENAGFYAYAVGGCVRDSILLKEPEDWDITTSATPAEVKSLFRRTFDTGLKHGTVTVLIGMENFEVTTYRIDGIYEDKRRPAEVTYTNSLADDLKRRDFTINAMAYNDRDGLIDLYDGLNDIKNKIIRCVGEAGERFSEDALRLMRAVRFSAQLGFLIEEKTKQAINDKASDLNHISAERIRVELVKLITSPHPEFLRVAYEAGLTAQFFPEFDACMQTGQKHPHHCYSVGEHIINAMKAVPADKVLRLAMMFHDIAKPLTKSVNQKTGNDSFKGHSEKGAEMARKIMRRLKFDNDTTDKVCRLVLYHDYDIDKGLPSDNLCVYPEPKIAEKYVRRAIARIGEDIYPLYLKVHKADILAQSDFLKAEKLAYLAELNRVYQKVKEKKQCVTLKDLAVSGNDLILAGIPQGKKIGKTLNALLEDVIDNPEHNNREYLLGVARKG